MTRKQALAKLIEKVEAGDATNDGSMFRAFGDKWTICFDAFHGSLDAALALHEAVLPGWGYVDLLRRGSRHTAHIAVDVFELTLTGVADTPARAWLLAIIKALHAEKADQ